MKPRALVALDREAKRRGLTVSDALRQALALWMATPEPARRQQQEDPPWLRQMRPAPKPSQRRG